ncbi:MAG: sugar ABC transporter ATP-binding protein [Spirochaetales bacterium]|nr:sugar ABC transporter ATP-binding protein [Spirochaetales bacterium]MBO6048429.1 sugar ABC transporter ATP-binding protein [Spirochaetales bacterium]MBO7349592.1 sugar ABC transporter ATP-binding protein [Spirochaetales bacterium]MBP5756478.1 sugar ABC transporter ATP-binding protein [Spirochaetales bacterium]
MKRILEMSHISKAFGGVKALTDVHLDVNEGEVHALLGENGAGKSTLMNILTGVLQADSGKITFLGKDYYTPTITQMEEAGIAFVHQELNVINDLTVVDNIFLTREITGKFGLIDEDQEIQKTKELFKSLGVRIDPTAMVRTLKTSEKQLLEICKALYTDAKLIILDEPTTSLSNEEIDHLFGILSKLREQGKSFIFISHKMPEIFTIADRYTVFRNGTFISSGDIKDTTPKDVTSDMVGTTFVDADMYEQRELGEEILKLHKLSGQGFSKINLSFRKGEIVAFTGLAGSGASELMQTMFGVLPIEGGSIEYKGKKLEGSIAHFMKNKIAMLPSNRKENSVIKDLSILENFYIAEHVLSFKKQIIKKSVEDERYEQQKKTLRIKAASSSAEITSLSGGNQQKVFLAKWLNTGAEVLLFNNPTRGVDVGAKAEIYRLILEFAKAGKTVIFNTLEIPEVQKIADRCVVFYGGKVAAILEHKDVSEKTVMGYSTGINSQR